MAFCGARVRQEPLISASVDVVGSNGHQWTMEIAWECLGFFKGIESDRTEMFAFYIILLDISQVLEI